VCVFEFEPVFEFEFVWGQRFSVLGSRRARNITRTEARRSNTRIKHGHELEHGLDHDHDHDHDDDHDRRHAGYGCWRCIPRGDLTGPNPTDRAKLGTKRHVLTDADGVPLAVTITGANVHDKWMVGETLDAMVLREPRVLVSPRTSASTKATTTSTVNRRYVGVESLLTSAAEASYRCSAVSRAGHAGARLAFVSSTDWMPGGGVSSADTLCQSDAIAAGLANPTRFRALLTTNGAATDASRFDLHGSPWFRPDGAQIVASAADLAAPLQGKLLTSISIEASGEHTDDYWVWTGAKSPGGPGATTVENCNQWTSGSSTVQGWQGLLHVTGEFESRPVFFAEGTWPCDTPARIYCFER
jgi:hypothetical protein